MYKSSDRINKQIKGMLKVLFLIISMVNYTVMLGLKFVQFGEIDIYEMVFMGYCFLFCGVVMYIYIKFLFDHSHFKLTSTLISYLLAMLLLCTHIIVVFTLYKFTFGYMGVVIQFLIFCIHTYITCEYFFINRKEVING